MRTTPASAGAAIDTETVAGTRGKWYAFEHGDIIPDMVTLAQMSKAMAEFIDAIANQRPASPSSRAHSPSEPRLSPAPRPPFHAVGNWCQRRPRQQR